MSATAPRSRGSRRSFRRAVAVPQQRRPVGVERVEQPVGTAPARRTSVNGAWALVGATLPVALVALLVVSGVAEVAGARPGAADGALGTVLYLAVAVPLAVAAVVGLRAWSRERDLVGLRAALLSVWCLLVGTAAVLVA